MEEVLLFRDPEGSINKEEKHAQKWQNPDSLCYSEGTSMRNSAGIRESVSLLGDTFPSEILSNSHVSSCHDSFPTRLSDVSNESNGSGIYFKRSSSGHTERTNYGTNASHHRHHHSNKGTGPSSESAGTNFLPTDDYSFTSASFSERLMALVDPSDWLQTGMKIDEDGKPYFDENMRWTVAAIVRVVLYNPIYPEFTSLQQFSWAVLIGITMGAYTAAWKFLIESCVTFMWKDLPEALLKWGFFTDLNGSFPLYHYMWIVPGLFGGILSYTFAALPNPIPGQNEWINNLHCSGIQSSDTFGHLFVLSTAGMASGLSLGPELPLILTAGMLGSWLGVLCKQSMLQARVLNLTAASAAIASFFGFPMAGALFVLEVPHRMGLQYFEALSPATISSIVAVLTNRLVTGNDVTGYYEYPFLNESLPSEIFTCAIVYGLFGGAMGMIYSKVVLRLKHRIHELFHTEIKHGKGESYNDTKSFLPNERVPLFNSQSKLIHNSSSKRPIQASRLIQHGPKQAAASGVFAGVLVGITGMLIPHVMFWGEAQLQTLIDKGRTPLPVFGRAEEPSADLLALSYCVTSSDKKSDYLGSSFSFGCSAAIAVAKIFVTGLSLGTGIVGGHFWGPLFVGCAASHFLTDLVEKLSTMFGIATNLNAYPCVALLCIMGSTHVVTFRAHMAIILILTLTIDAFDPEDGVDGIKVAGDYSAVFPLLTVAVFVACQVSRHTIFYEKQRSRGDIMALPEVLCEPGKEGSPLVIDYEGHLDEIDDQGYDLESQIGSESDTFTEDPTENFRTIDHGLSQKDIEDNFEATKRERSKRNGECKENQNPNWVMKSSQASLFDTPSIRTSSLLPPRPHDNSGNNVLCEIKGKENSRILDDLLNDSVKNVGVGKDLTMLDDLLNEKKSHRRTRSEPLEMESIDKTVGICWNKKPEGVGHQRRPSLKRVDSFGQVDQEQPSLLDQARRRCASYATAEISKTQRKNMMQFPNMTIRKNSH